MHFSFLVWVILVMEQNHCATYRYYCPHVFFSSMYTYTHSDILCYSSDPAVSGRLLWHEAASNCFSVTKKIPLRKKAFTNLLISRTRNVECWAFKITFEPDPQTSRTDGNVSPKLWFLHKNYIVQGRILQNGQINLKGLSLCDLHGIAQIITFLNTRSCFLK